MPPSSSDRGAERSEPSSPYVQAWYEHWSDFRLPGLLDDDGAAVPADVDERALGAALVPHDDDRNPAGPAGDDVLLSEDTDVLPRPSEDRFLLALEHRGIPVPGPRSRGEPHPACGS